VACTRCGQAQTCPEPSDGAPAPVVNTRPSGLRVLAGVVALFAVAAAAWMVLRVGAGAGVTASFAAALPTEVLQRSILEANVGLPGDPDLVRQYREISAKHFGGGLPAMPVRWEPRLEEVGRLARQAFTLEGMFGHVGDRAAVLVHPNLRNDPAALARTLSHEMVHVHLWRAGDDSGTKHGPAFQRELARLSAEGAFTGIVATPGEREDLRRWIDGERGRLQSLLASERQDQEALDRERAELEESIAAAQGAAADSGTLEALEARRRSYNQRVDEAKTRAEQRAVDAGALNTEIDRYNLMLSYPDGLDYGEATAGR
jgi:hypothetical protein